MYVELLSILQEKEETNWAFERPFTLPKTQYKNNAYLSQLLPPLYILPSLLLLNRNLLRTCWVVTQPSDFPSLPLRTWLAVMPAIQFTSLPLVFDTSSAYHYSPPETHLVLKVKLHQITSFSAPCQLFQEFTKSQHEAHPNSYPYLRSLGLYHWAPQQNANWALDF